MAVRDGPSAKSDKAQVLTGSVIDFATTCLPATAVFDDPSLGYDPPLHSNVGRTLPAP